MYITQGAIALLVFLVSWILCGILCTLGTLVILYGTLWWGIGYLVGGILLTAGGSLWAYRINRRSPT